MQKFCTLEDVAEIYEISLDELVTDLNNHDPKDQNSNSRRTIL